MSKEQIQLPSVAGVVEESCHSEIEFEQLASGAIASLMLRFP